MQASSRSVNVKLRWQHLIAALLLVATTLVMTFPLVGVASHAVTDPGDPLLNSWILAWSVQQIRDGNAGGYFDANIFYPHQRTLAYSEHLFPQSLVALVPLVVSGNPILAYNLVLFFAFASSAFGAYLLARHLTGSFAGAMVAGVTYGFAPFMFSHLPHLQVICAGGIPLTLLFLYRHFERGRVSDLAGFCLFFVLQALANGYYALFLSFFVALAIVYHASLRRRWLDTGFWARHFVAGLVAATVIAPFFAQYLAFQREMQFTREATYNASLGSYFAAPFVNRLYGDATSIFGRDEAHMFPGLVAFALATVGMVLTRRRQAEASTASLGAPSFLDRRLAVLTLRLVARALAVSIVLVATLVSVRGQSGWSLHLDAAGATRLLSVVGSAYLLAVLATTITRARSRRLPDREEESTGFFLILGLMAVLFTFGMDGPYALLHHYVPGFDGVRSPARWNVFVGLAIAVFAAFGVREVSASLASRSRSVFSFAAATLILVEYFSAPLPTTKVPTRDELPSVYRWVSSSTSMDSPILELPLPLESQGVCEIECLRLYMSTFHFRPLVNGYSGYYPPMYNELRRRWEQESFASNLADAEALGVRYLLLHHSGWREGERERIEREADELPTRLRRIDTGDDQATVLELLQVDRTGREERSVATVKVLASDGWRVSSSVNDNDAGLALDGDRSTRWTTGPQRRGMWFALHFPEERLVGGVRLDLGSSVFDYPRGFQVEVSGDGTEWTSVASSPRRTIPIRSFLTPANLGVEIAFAPRRCRHLRISLLGRDKTHYWSIHEIALAGAR